VLNGALMSEDQGALLIDIDNDADLDLFVVSGGVEATANDANLQDRLYLNEGRWRFKEATDLLPKEMDNGSALTAADFDRDGDVDLFIGGRSVPGAYPSAAASHLWINEKGRFTEAEEKLMPGRKDLGIVSSAVWSDANGDSWPDLLVTEEWGPVRLFLNQKGQLVEKMDTGVRERHGWWNGLAKGDVDQDGDIDYVATNFGLNTKYHPTDENPALIYYGDLDGTGKKHIVEAEYEEKREVPIRGKSCSSAAMPFIKKKFDTYHSFALATVQEIYTPEKLKNVKRYHAGTLATALLRNDGQGGFTLETLPDLAQTAPAFGVVIEDVTGDTHPDILIAQNFYHPQIETGRMSGGVGVLLKNNGQGQFATVWSDLSGVDLPIDARSATLGDWDGDGRREWLIAENNGPLYQQKLREEKKWPTLRLKAPASQLYGARVTVKQGEKSFSREITAGEGYLSQAIPTIMLSGYEALKETQIEVRWADGRITERTMRSLGDGVEVAAE
jgi:enediyne biosynthesis protein E4